MYKNTHCDEAPWHIIDSNNKKKARVEILELLVEYFQKGLSLEPEDPSLDLVEALKIERQHV